MGTEAILPIRLIPRLRSGFGVERSQVRGGTLDLIGRTSLPLPRQRRDWRGRHGRGVSRHRHEARSRETGRSYPHMLFASQNCVELSGWIASTTAYFRRPHWGEKAAYRFCLAVLTLHGGRPCCRIGHADNSMPPVLNSSWINRSLCLKNSR